MRIVTDLCCRRDIPLRRFTERLRREVISLLRTFPHSDIGSYLQGHPDMNKRYRELICQQVRSGQGVCAAGGMALAAKLDKKDYRVYSILGDGELEEGQVWEQAMFAPHYKLDNYIC